MPADAAPPNSRDSSAKSSLDNVIHVEFGSRMRSRSPTRSLEPSSSSQAAAEVPKLIERRAKTVSHKDPLADLYAREEVEKLLGLSVSTLKRFEKAGFVPPSARNGRRVAYSFQDLIALRAARDLLAQGIPEKKVRAAVNALRTSLPEVSRPLAELRILADGQTLVVHKDDSTFEPQTGQLRLDFEVRELRAEVVRTIRPDRLDPQRRRAAYEAYLEGCRLDEDDASFEKAVAAYEQAIELDDKLAHAYTNLGNLLCRRGNFEESELLYQEALAIDHEQPEAHYNLGFLTQQKGDLDGAIAHFKNAVHFDPSFADAHFNLALSYEELCGSRGAVAAGSSSPCEVKAAAILHWKKYLELDPEGEWSEIAKRYLIEASSR